MNKKDRISKGEVKIYSGFLTNLAVAWYTAGVITPIFTFTDSDFARTLFLGVSGGVISFICLRLAVRIMKK